MTPLIKSGSIGSAGYCTAQRLPWTCSDILVMDFSRSSIRSDISCDLDSYWRLRLANCASRRLSAASTQSVSWCGEVISCGKEERLAEDDVPPMGESGAACAAGGTARDDWFPASSLALSVLVVVSAGTAEPEWLVPLVSAGTPAWGSAPSARAALVPSGSVSGLLMAPGPGGRGCDVVVVRARASWC